MERRHDRRRAVAAAWNGSVEGGHVHYAAPGHPEYLRHPLNGILYWWRGGGGEAAGFGLERIVGHFRVLVEGGSIDTPSIRL